MTDKCTAAKLPQRPSRIADGTIAEIVRLDLRQVPHAEIARRLQLNKRTVSRVLDRMRAALTITSDVASERARAIATYREIQRSAWEAADVAQRRGRSPAMLLAEVRQAQQRIDALLGLAPSGPDDPTTLLVQLRTIVVGLIQREAPELGPRLAQKLLTIGDANGRSEGHDHEE